MALNFIPAHLWQIPPVGTVFELFVSSPHDEEISLFSRGICVNGDDIYVRRGWMPFPSPATPLCCLPRPTLERFSRPCVTIGYRRSSAWMYRTWKSFAKDGASRKDTLEASHLYLPSPTMVPMEISPLNGYVFQIDEFRWARHLRFAAAKVEASDVFVEFMISNSGVRCTKNVPVVKLRPPFSISEVCQSGWMSLSVEDMMPVSKLLHELESSEQL